MTVSKNILPLLLGDGHMDVAGRAKQEAKAAGLGEGIAENTLIPGSSPGQALTFSQREKGLKARIIV